MPAPASHPRVARRRFLAHRAPIPDGAAIAPLTGSGTEMKSSDGHSKAPPNKAKTLSQECKSKMFQICKVKPIIHRSEALARAPRIRLAIVAGAIFALCSIVVPSAVAAQTQPLIGNHPTANVANMRSHADAARPLNIHISFAPRNPVALAKLLADLQNPTSARYHKWLSPAQFNTNFGRSAD